MFYLDNPIGSLIYFSDVFSTERLIELCHGDICQVVMVTDNHVGSIYADKLSTYLQSHQIITKIITIPAGEHSKSREMKTFIEDTMFSFGCGRDTLLIALGGGVITDLVGYVAATYCRGIPVIYMPTSLLAMVDASIGGKTGINSTYGKNTIGTFTQPKAIFIDINFLNTLPDVEYFGAFSEMIKHALIYDEDYFSLIESNLENIYSKNHDVLALLVEKSCAIKSQIVAEDEKENNKREICNFGHTIGHALEHASGYQLSHGQAVAIGMIAESFLSNQLGYLSDNDFMRLKNLITTLVLNKELMTDISKDELMNALSLDKKVRKQQCRFVILERIGKVLAKNNSYAHVVEASQIKNAIDYLFDLMMSAIS